MTTGAMVSENNGEAALAATSRLSMAAMAMMRGGAGYDKNRQTS